MGSTSLPPLLLLLTFLVSVVVISGAASEVVQSGWYSCEYPATGCNMLVGGGSILELDVPSMIQSANMAGNTTAVAMIIAPRLNSSSIVVNCSSTTAGMYPPGVSLDLNVWGMEAAGDDGSGAVVRVVGVGLWCG